MTQKIKLTVYTGWANGEHVDYWDLPDNWGDFNEEEKQKYIDECAQEYLHECCSAGGEVIDEDDDE